MTLHALKRSRFLLSCLLMLGLSGCGLFKADESAGDPKLDLQTVNIILDADANNDSATAIDLVVVYKLELLKSLSKMTASEYFALADQIRRDYPEMMKVWHWELTPGQTLNSIDVDSSGAVGAFVFAHYLTPGSHRVRVGSSDTIHILLKKEDLCIIEQRYPEKILLLPASKEKDRVQKEQLSPSKEIRQKQLNSAANKMKGESTCRIKEN